MLSCDWLSQQGAYRLLGLAWSMARYHVMQHNDEPPRASLQAVATCYPRYGYSCLLHALLRQEGL
ncbi:hypothetical protein [Vreelandella janggokensis]|uniref:hypothetical protein n=1 Tax=Vreelandella janggokensis TaxID=370767 RepID=UPI0022A7D411|nr:hypothetical protein [Halomonas janggokensis]